MINSETHPTEAPVPIPPQPKLRIGITHGDTNGVGYELIYKAFEDAGMFELCTPVVYGSARVATYHKKAFNRGGAFNLIEDGAAAEDGQLNLVNCFAEEVKVEFGRPSADSGEAARRALEAAVADYKAGKIDAIVTAPISKAAIHGQKFPFSGHTEFFASCFEGEALMILCNDLMRVALLTTHIPIRDVATAITPELLESKLRLLFQALRSDFLLSAPRVAVLGLNPHCGDEGVAGSEEAEIIRPVVNKLASEGLDVFGPFAADGFFGTGAYRQFDAVLAMYHDQGLAPLKALSMQGVNITCGLDVIRTSPDHGTAYDIAGEGVADETSFRQAIYAAIDICRNRRADKQAHAHPLPKLFHDRREDNDASRRFPRETTPQ